jgi:hypothetical protein
MFLYLVSFATSCLMGFDEDVRSRVNPLNAIDDGRGFYSPCQCDTPKSNRRRVTIPHAEDFPRLKSSSAERVLRYNSAIS